MTLREARAIGAIETRVARQVAYERETARLVEWKRRYDEAQKGVVA